MAYDLLLWILTGFTYIKLPFDGLCSDKGYEKISNVQECNDTAKQLQLTFKKEERSEYPKGCYQYGSIYWNTHDVGKDYNDTRLHRICRISGKFWIKTNSLKELTINFFSNFFRPWLTNFVLLLGNNSVTNLGKRYEFEPFRNGEYTCSEKSIYTRFNTTKCDGWGKTSLEECKQKCMKNEIPSDCSRNKEICQYVIWVENEDWHPGYCQLANRNCKATKPNINDITILRMIGKIIWWYFQEQPK